jgi:hypothetical protein
VTAHCHSGAAIGSDAAWGKYAALAGDVVIHQTFRGHRDRAPVPEDTLAHLTQEELAEAEEHLVRANRTLRRNWHDASQHTINLLCRNWFQVECAGAVRAIVEFDSRGRIKGGTAWAVQMFIDAGIGTRDLKPNGLAAIAGMYA